MSSFFESVDYGVGAGGDEEFASLVSCWLRFLGGGKGGGGEGGSGGGEGGKGGGGGVRRKLEGEGGGRSTFLGSWKETCPVAMLESFLRFAQGV